MWKRSNFKVSDYYDSIIKFGLDYEKAIQMLNDIFYNLPVGILELGVHPGYINNGQEYMGGYLQEREVEMKALTSDNFKNIIKNSGVELISFKDI